MEQGAHGGAAVTGVGVGLVLILSFASGGEVQLELVAAFRCTHNRILRRVLTEVNPRLVFAERFGDRNTGFDELRLPISGPLVSIRRDEPVSVGVDDRVVVPRLGVQPIEV